MNITTHILPFCVIELNSTLPYSCTNPYPNCTNAAGFQFASIWVITKAIYDACPSDPRLFGHTEALTQEACEVFAGSSWTVYPAGDIWSRLTTWKFPLLQLVAVFPRPPLNFTTELFVLCHLMGDPISTISNLLLKVASCQSRALFWKEHFSEGGKLEHLIQAEIPKDHNEERALMWKGLTAIIDSYDEWGQAAGDRAQRYICGVLSSVEGAGMINEDDRLEFLRICRLTGNALAADRSTKFLPIIVAQAFFISSIAVAYGRTRQSAALANPQTFINIEAFSVAFSAMYFWIIPAVFLSSVVGASQTENAIPRILGRFENDVRKRFPEWEVNLPNAERDDMTTAKRERSGGIYSWQPADAQDEVKRKLSIGSVRKQGLSMSWLSAKHLLAWTYTLQPGSFALSLAMVTYSTLTGILISYLIPPIGFDCRHWGEIAIFLGWIASACANLIPFPAGRPKLRFRFILIKDIIATAATVGGIIVTQVGVLNRCSCYTGWGRYGLALPEWHSVSGVLFRRIHDAYPAISFTTIGFMLLIVPLMIVKQYELAVRVFLQRDDDKSNLNWLDDVLRIPENSGRAVVWVGKKAGRFGASVKDSYLALLGRPQQHGYGLSTAHPSGG